MGSHYKTFLLLLAWAPRFRDCLVGISRLRCLGFEILGPGFEVWSAGSDVLSLGFDFLGLGLKVLGLGFEALGLGFGVFRLGFDVSRPGLRDFTTTLRSSSVVARLGFEGLRLPYRTFASWRAWASRLQGCLARLLRRGEILAKNGLKSSGFERECLQKLKKTSHEAKIDPALGLRSFRAKMP